MIDLTLLRENPQYIIDRIKTKDPDWNGEKLYTTDQKIRHIKQEVETLRHQKNELAKAAQNGITTKIREQSKNVGQELKKKEALLKEVEKEFTSLCLSTPNIPQTDVPIGGKESNQVIKIVGEKPSFTFEPKHHLELAENLNWLDFEIGAKLTGSNFAFYKSDAVKLMYALPMFMLKNNIEYGYQPVIPSVLINETSLQVAGNFPKFKDDVYSIENDNLYLTPTAEVNLANMYRDHIFTQDQLPIRLTAWTSCFRKEAGNYGAHERGLIRLHQFEKIELFTLCEPEKSSEELDRMIACAESILQKLDLHYRISLLATQDISFQSAKTYDIEVWLPGQKEYYEVSSASNCLDFQARRGKIRYRNTGTHKTEYVHTLNGSSLALPRLLVAIMETYQQADGSIALPSILKNEGIF